MIKPINIDYLYIALTQQCNLACRHCLRGNARNKSIDNATLNNVFKDVSNVYDLILTGGETFLHPELLLSVNKAILKNNSKVFLLGLVTNGTIWNDNIKDALLSLSDATQHVILGISNDDFHKEEIKRLGLHDYTESIIDFSYKNHISTNVQDLREMTLVPKGRAKNLTPETLPNHGNLKSPKYLIQKQITNFDAKKAILSLGCQSYISTTSVNVNGDVGGREEEWEYYDNPENVIFNINNMTFKEYIESQQ